MDTLEYLANSFELVVFTAAEQDYADKILDKIDPEHRLI